MQRKSLPTIFAILYLTLNIFYLFSILHMKNDYVSIMQSDLMPLTKLWLIDLLAFVKLDGLRGFTIFQSGCIFVLFFIIHFAALIGLLMKKRWGLRILNFVLICMCLFGIFWPGISQRSTEAMQTYMQRAYNAWVYNHYWQPLKEEFGFSKKEKAVGQYEPTSDNHSLANSYKEAEYSIESELSGEPKEINSLFPAFWGLYRMSSDAFETTKEMYQVLFQLAKFLFYIWFVVIPLGLLYVLHKENVQRSLEPQFVHQENSSSSQQSFSDLVIEIIVSGLIIMVVQSFGGLYSIPLIIYFCFLGYTLSMKASLQYPKCFWLYGICYIGMPILFNIQQKIYLYYRYDVFTIFSMLDLLGYAIIYLFCYWGGSRGRKFIQKIQPNNY